MSRLAGRFALVTGGTRGIGLAVALRFAEEGATVAVNCQHDSDDARQALKAVRDAGREAGHGVGRHLIVAADIADIDAVEVMFKHTFPKWHAV